MQSIAPIFITLLIFLLAYFSLVGSGWVFLTIRFKDKEERALALKRDHKGSYINAALDHFNALLAILALIVFLIFVIVKVYQAFVAG